MRYAITVAFSLLAGHAAFADPPKPAVVLQTKPTARMLAEVREMIRQVAGPVEAERLVKEFDAGLKSNLGEQGFEGIDANRPVGAYAVLGDTFQASTLVLVVPVTGEKEFIGLLERMKFTTEPVKDKKGTYRLMLLVKGALPRESYLQFEADGWVYVCLNCGEPIDSRNLVTTATIFDRTDPSLASVKIYPGRVPEKFAKSLLEDIDRAAGGVKAFVGGGGVPRHMADLFTALFDGGPKLARRYVETGLKEAGEVALRFGWDPATGETSTELTVIPNPGSPLARSIATRTPSPNRFAHLVPKQAAAGVVFDAPQFAPELRSIVEAAIEAARQELRMSDLPEAFHPLLGEIAKGLTRSVKKGELDGAIALVPGKDGRFTLVGGVRVEDTAAIEKELRQAGKLASLLKHFEFDAAKEGGVSIHKVPLHRAIPGGASAARALGAEAPGYVAFAKEAVFLSLGPDALPAIKTAIAAKPGPAPALEVTGNLKHLHALVGTMVDDKAAGHFAKHVGAEDRTFQLFRITIDGGEKLTVRMSVNLRYIPRAFMLGEFVDESVQPLPPPPR